jgi:hypothetical protein
MFLQHFLRHEDVSGTVVRLSFLFPGDSSIPFIEEKLITAVKKIMSQGVRGEIALLGSLETLSDTDKRSAFHLFYRRVKIPSNQPTAFGTHQPLHIDGKR